MPRRGRDSAGGSRLSSSSPPPTSFRDDELVVNYRDAVVYGRDLRLFEGDGAGGGWLNDACIHYHLARLEQRHRERRRRREGEREEEGEVWLMDPAALSFLVHQCDLDDEDELRDFVYNGYGGFRGVARFFLPVNDTMASDEDASSPLSWAVPGNGTHWSLLVAAVAAAETTAEFSSSRAPSLEFHHLDSLPGSNTRAAAAVAGMWQRAWSFAAQARPQSTTTAPPTVVECDVPRQANGYDCGVHVIATAEALLQLDEGADGGAGRGVTGNSNESRPRREEYEALVRRYFEGGGGPASLCGKLRRRVADDIRSVAAAAAVSQNGE